jgi:hypothetical protein
MQNSQLLLLVLVIVGFVYYFYMSTKSEQQPIMKPTNLKISIFADQNYDNPFGDLGPGNYNSNFLNNINYNNANNEISSIRVPNGLKAELYNAPDFSGEPAIFTKDSPAMPPGYNDSIKSIKVIQL